MNDVWADINAATDDQLNDVVFFHGIIRRVYEATELGHKMTNASIGPLLRLRPFLTRFGLGCGGAELNSSTKARNEVTAQEFKKFMDEWKRGKHK